ncbi:MAG: hypothetical protein EOM35_02375 [Negativicutes bacterium]|nr:hypothetical protein [Negativicutes bacterium]
MKEATFPERRQAQRIAKSLRDRYGTKRTSELLGISKGYVRSVISMSRRSKVTSRGGQIAYYVPHKVIFHIIETAKQVVLG